MSNSSWRGTILFTVIMVTLGVTVGLKLYGLGEGVAAAPSASTSTPAAASPGSTGAAPTPSAPVPAPSQSAPSAAAPQATQPQQSATKVVTGSAVDTRYGPVQVKVTFSGTTITAVDTVQSPSGNGRDIEINNQALPILQQEVLSSQSAKVDTVSGATYTSDGYIQSVQSAIDQR